MAIDYLLINFAVGVGIALDAMILTLASFTSFHDRRAAFTWAGAIGTTHWLFPMLGFIGGWYLSHERMWAITVYSFGGLIMTCLVISVLRQNVSSSTSAEAFPVLFQRRGGFLAAVWGVSVDAIMSGPGKTAVTASWSEAAVWLSFVLVGVTVFALVLVAGAIAIHLNVRYRSGLSALDKEQLQSRLRDWFVLGTWTEILIFIYFAAVAYVEAVRMSGITIPRWAAVPVVLVSFFFLLTAFRSQVRACQSNRASAAALATATTPSQTAQAVPHVLKPRTDE